MERRAGPGEDRRLPLHFQEHRESVFDPGPGAQGKGRQDGSSSRHLSYSPGDEKLRRTALKDSWPVRIKKRREDAALFDSGIQALSPSRGVHGEEFSGQRIEQCEGSLVRNPGINARP